MSVELQMLCWSVVLGLVYVLVAAGFGTWQRGLRWNAGNRDGEPQPLNKYAARADRANRNFLETFAFFAAATLAVVAMHKTGAQTLIGAQIYFWARLAYLPVYVIGIPYLRTAIWIASLWGILQMVEALLR
ncbi:MAPEG family protein [Rhodanobacter sp. DHB23]|uniref:MAPEG family protein n=1 Tax=Rhodanobacter sp. DHB23 TaxID=2775923 RepID=UPI001780A8E7|nr:MAPEG family protein [Rhodanobacter sp. DHB23]MBD8873702.1 MAPEG family protein [Rhodanobacter sp. DHB23]